jgi:hypothetical protein
MAFCNSCGATLNEGGSFCSKCGAPVSGTTAPRPAAATAAPPRTTPPVPGAPAAPAQSSNAVRNVLIIVGVVIVCGIIGIALLTAVGLHIAKRTRVMQQGDHVKVETPFGNVEASKDPELAAKELGVDIYPGANLDREGASTASVAGIRTTTANFHSSDSPDQVCRFYQNKFPNSRVSTSGGNRCTIVSDDHDNVVTINVDGSGDSSHFQITTVMKHVSSDQ